ncbi:MAG TPA: mechanosensitive ion channel domain-containing protein [Vicinamibacterales bacterium]|nr:mechanosensitive ion channel domain-containing protein [Vicinamibacterales bacterium]
MQLFGIRLLGVNSDNATKLLLSLAVIGAVIFVRYLIVWIARAVTGEEPNERTVFWTRQGASLVTTIIGVLALLSIWFEDPTRLGTAAGLIGAGLAFALQKVVTAFAGYLVILRGKTFTVGDRITMGGVRGDVISLGFLQTRIMEMGEPPSAQSDSQPIWVRARQHTGRIVSVTNDKVFDEPIYNYTREFPYMWEEIKIPITYQTDRKMAEHILLDCAREVTESTTREAEAASRAFERRYFIALGSLEPRVFMRITDNWVEMNLRILVPIRGVRYCIDELSRLIMERFEQAGIGIASGTYAIVEFPPLRIEGPVAERIAEGLQAREQTHTRPRT